MTTSGTHNPASRGDGWLWASAAALTGAVLLAASGAFDRTAYAEMATVSGGLSAMTTDGGNDEILVLTDDRSEALMVYQVASGKRLDLLARQDLPAMFRDARVQFAAP